VTTSWRQESTSEAHDDARAAGRSRGPELNPSPSQAPDDRRRLGRHALAVELVTKAAQAPDERTGAAIDAGITSLAAMIVNGSSSAWDAAAKVAMGVAVHPVRHSSREYAHAI